MALSESTTEEFYWEERTAKARVQFDDVLLNSTGRGTLGRASCYRLNELAIADNHVAIIRPDKSICCPLYMSLFLNSPLGQFQSEMYQSGSSGQLELYPQHIEKFLIFLPRTSSGKVDVAWQEGLAEKVAKGTEAKIRAQLIVKQVIENINEIILSD